MIHKVEKSWGKEDWLVNNELYCGKILTCIKDVWSSQGNYHYHKNKDETFFILEGCLILDIEGVEHRMAEGQARRILPTTKHRFKALTPICRVIEISTHHEDSDSYRVDKLG